MPGEKAWRISVLSHTVLKSAHSAVDTAANVKRIETKCPGNINIITVTSKKVKEYRWIFSSSHKHSTQAHAQNLKKALTEGNIRT